MELAPMPALVLLIVGIAGVIGLAFLYEGFRTRRRDGSEHVPTDTSSGGEYSGWRRMALATRRAQLDSLLTSEGPVYGVLMETGFPVGSATLFVLGDGHTSLYYSGGGGTLGRGLHENVRQFVGSFIESANRCREQMTPADPFPLPAPGHTIFYALTDSGVLTGGGLSEDLGGDGTPLSPLYHAGHEVLTQLRYMEWRSPALSMLTEKSGPTSLWPDSIAHGVLKETGVGAAVTTAVLALINGRAGMCVLPGRAFFDADQLPENLRRANAQFVEAASSLVRHLHPTESRPVPTEGHSTFYVATDAGILSGTALTEELESGRHALSPLYRAGEEVLEQGRLTAQASREGRI